MRRVLLVLIGLILFSVANVCAEKHERAAILYEWSDTGQLEFPWDDNQLVVWHVRSDSAKAAIFVGIITGDTKVKIVFPFNKSPFRGEYSTEGILRLLSGRRVTVYGTFYRTGRGEGSRTYFSAITLFVSPKPIERGYPFGPRE